MDSRLDQAVAKTDVLRKMYVDAGDFAMLPLIDQMQDSGLVSHRNQFSYKPKIPTIRELFKS